MFRKGGVTVKGAAHLCSEECAQQFFALWIHGELPELELAEEVKEPFKSAAVVVVPPDPEDAAMRNSLLASVVGRG